MDILNGEGSVVDGTTATLASSGMDVLSGALYEYSLWANLGEELAFFPRDPRYN